MRPAFLFLLPPVSPRTRSILTQIGGLALAVLLLWLALRGLHVGELRRALATANWGWMPVLVLIMLLAHALRAWRWVLLQDGLPAQPHARRIRTPFAFAAVMIGYMVNYAAPRVGEVVRTTTLAKESRRPFSTILGTIVLERLLDVLALALGLLTVSLLLGSRLGALGTLFAVPEDGLPRPTWILVILGVGVLSVAVALLLWRTVQRRAAMRSVPSWWNTRVQPLLASFRGGLASVRTSPNRAGIVVATLAIWLLYGLVAWVPFALLGIADLYSLSLLDGWVIMLVGSLGMVVPTPGGAGSYHYVTIQTLMLLYGVALTDAQVYAVLAHASQLVLYTLVGAVCLLIVIGRNRSRAQATVQAQP